MKSEVIANFYNEVFDILELREVLKITGKHEDFLIQNLLQGVIKYAENLMGFELSRKILRIKGRIGNIKLKEPLISIHSLKSENQSVNFMLNNNKLQPILNAGKDIMLIYEVGFIKSEIPNDIKAAILQHIVSMYDFTVYEGKIPHFSLDVYNNYRKIKI